MIGNNVKAALALLITTGAIKTWQSGEAITGSDLNSALTHIHTKMVGGHGARLVDADVSASANINGDKIGDGTLPTDKLVAHRYVPIAWGTMTPGSICAAGTCTTSSTSSNITSVTWLATGLYQVTMSAARPNGLYSVSANSVSVGVCGVDGTVAFTTTIFRISCFDYAGIATNASASFIVFDNDGA